MIFQKKRFDFMQRRALVAKNRTNEKNLNSSLAT